MKLYTVGYLEPYHGFIPEAVFSSKELAKAYIRSYKPYLEIEEFELDPDFIKFDPDDHAWTVQIWKSGEIKSLKVKDRMPLLLVNEPSAFLTQRGLDNWVTVRLRAKSEEGAKALALSIYESILSRNLWPEDHLGIWREVNL